MGKGDGHVLECPHITWGLLWNWLKAASLYVMGNLGLNTLADVIDVV